MRGIMVTVIFIILPHPSSTPADPFALPNWLSSYIHFFFFCNPWGLITVDCVSMGSGLFTGVWTTFYGYTTEKESLLPWLPLGIGRGVGLICPSFVHDGMLKGPVCTGLVQATIAAVCSWLPWSCL